MTAKMLPTLWAGNAIRVEHLIAPVPNVPRGIHVGDCQCRCGEMQTCPKCRRVASVAAVKGRWDAEAGCTARPFDAVWVRLSCGCEAGDRSLAEPPVECGHDVVEFDPGNRVPPYGWEQYPGWYCTTCGEQIDEDERR